MAAWRQQIWQMNILQAHNWKVRTLSFGKSCQQQSTPALLWLDYEMAIGFHFTAPFLAQSTIIPWAAASEKVMETPSIVMSLSC